MLKNAVDFLTGNLILNLAILAWALAQVIKFVITLITKHKLDFRNILSSGGMPSSHSALVCAVSVGVAKKLGYASPEFALSLAMAGIVMYDAMGVRRAAGEQAKVLNKMVIDFKEIFQMLKEEFDALARGEDVPEERGGPNKRLKEFLGHTPLEVLCGAALGILIAALIPAF